MTAPTPDPTPYWALTADELTPGAVAAHFGSEVLDPLARIIAFYQHCGYAATDPTPRPSSRPSKGVAPPQPTSLSGRCGPQTWTARWRGGRKSSRSRPTTP